MELTSTWLADGYDRPALSYVRIRTWSAWEVAAAWLIAAFFAVEVAIVATVANGPTLDEGIYITSGRRTLEGHGVGDGYLGLVRRLAAVAGSRRPGRRPGRGWPGRALLAAVFLTIAVAAMWRAALVLFDARSAFFAVALAVASGPVLALGHLAVIDAPVRGRRGRGALGRGRARPDGAPEVAGGGRRWPTPSACSRKYPAADAGVALALLIVALRGRRAMMDLALFGLIAGAVLDHLLPVRPRAALVFRGLAGERTTRPSA